MLRGPALPEKQSSNEKIEIRPFKEKMSDFNSTLLQLQNNFTETKTKYITDNRFCVYNHSIIGFTDIGKSKTQAI